MIYSHQIIVGFQNLINSHNREISEYDLQLRAYEYEGRFQNMIYSLENIEGDFI